MNDSKLVRMLMLLEDKEQKPLLRFSAASLLYEDLRVGKLLKWLFENLAGNNTADLNKEKAFRAVFGRERYNDTDMRVLMTKTLQTVSQFISFREFQKDDWKQEKEMLSFLLMKKQYGHLEKRIVATLARFQNEKVKDHHHFLKIFELEQIHYRLLSRQNRDFEFNHLFSGIEGFYFYLKLKFLAIRINNKYVYNREVQPHFLREITDHFEQKRFDDNPAIICYSHAILMQVSENPKAHLKALQQCIEGKGAIMDPDDLSILSKLSENYCVRQINKGLREYYDVLHHLMADRLKREPEIFAAEYKNLITIYLRLGKMEDALSFMENFRNHIYPMEVRADAYNYAKSRYYFHLKNYKEVLHLLQQVSYFDEFYKIDSKKLLIQTFYELKEWDSLESAMNPFRVFIHRNKAVSDIHKLNNQHFINLLFQLIPLRSGKTRKLEKLKKL
ncbi:MAG TPA: hypothetical protein PLD84_15750, partial [Chitinophagales bacterium]|nr:hypothetical protein [Chitinophagales bacterium]